MTESGIKKLMIVILGVIILATLVFIYFLPVEKQDGDGHYKEDKKQAQEKKKSK